MKRAIRASAHCSRWRWSGPLKEQLDPARQWLVLCKRRRGGAGGLVGAVASTLRRGRRKTGTLATDEQGGSGGGSGASDAGSAAATSPRVAATSSSATSASSPVANVDVGPQFSIDLARVVARVGGLPTVVRRCVTHIEANGLDVEGIYRLSGSSARINELANMVDCGGELWFAAGTPIHDVCGLLKLYLRELPDAVLTKRLYPYFLAAGTCEQSESSRNYFLRAAVTALPAPERDAGRVSAAALGQSDRARRAEQDAFAERVDDFWADFAVRPRTATQC